MSFWHHLSYPIIGLSPMDGLTDASFRRIVASYGQPGVVFTEFTNVNEICHGSRKSWESLQYSECERPIVAQLYGKVPSLFYQAAHIICELGFDGLDINMGCPSKNVSSSGSGAGLIRTPELALEIMAAAKRGITDWAQGQTLAEAGVKLSIIDKTIAAQSSQKDDQNSKTRRAIPMTIKTRLGYDSNIINEWSNCLRQGSPEVISIHGRTLQQMYRGEADWEAITHAAEFIKHHGILVLGNGDIRSLNDAITRIRSSGVDGVLIGRAALGNPWFFQGGENIRKATRDGDDSPIKEAVVSLEERFDMMLKHATMFESLNDASRFPRMRKHLGWYCHGFSHAAEMRARMFKTTSSRDVMAILQEYSNQHGFSQPMVLAH